MAGTRRSRREINRKLRTGASALAVPSPDAAAEPSRRVDDNGVIDLSSSSPPSLATTPVTTTPSLASASTSKSNSIVDLTFSSDSDSDDEDIPLSELLQKTQLQNKPNNNSDPVQDLFIITLSSGSSSSDEYQPLTKILATEKKKARMAPRKLPTEKPSGVLTASTRVAGSRRRAPRPRRLSDSTHKQLVAAEERMGAGKKGNEVKKLSIQQAIKKLEGLIARTKAMEQKKFAVEHAEMTMFKPDEEEKQDEVVAAGEVANIDTGEGVLTRRSHSKALSARQQKKADREAKIAAENEEYKKKLSAKVLWTAEEEADLQQLHREIKVIYEQVARLEGKILGVKGEKESLWARRIVNETVDNDEPVEASESDTEGEKEIEAGKSDAAKGEDYCVKEPVAATADVQSIGGMNSVAVAENQDLGVKEHLPGAAKVQDYGVKEPLTDPESLAIDAENLARKVAAELALPGPDDGRTLSKCGLSST